MNEIVNDLAETIIPDSTQLTAQDLLLGDYVIRITAAKVVLDDKQKLWLSFHGDKGRPYKPCLTMRLVITSAWGGQSKTCIGRRLHLFRDPKAVWGGLEVGGIRIKRASHLKGPMIIPARKNRGVIVPYRIEPLPDDVPDTFPVDGDNAPLDVEALKVAATEAAFRGLDQLEAYWATLGGARQRVLKPHIAEIKKLAGGPLPAVENLTSEPENDRMNSKG